jgi:hypothetical protein
VEGNREVEEGDGVGHAETGAGRFLFELLLLLLLLLLVLLVLLLLCWESLNV